MSKHNGDNSESNDVMDKFDLRVYLLFRCYIYDDKIKIKDEKITVIMLD